MAKLHVICGNCGCNDMLTFHIDLKGSIKDDEETPFRTTGSRNS